jgi:hypothetical protein
VITIALNSSAMNKLLTKTGRKMIDNGLPAIIEGGGYSVIARLVELGRRKSHGL